jgi:hypothetical protein
MEFQKKNPKGQKKKKNPSARVYALSSFYFYFLKQAVIHPYLLLKKKKVAYRYIELIWLPLWLLELQGAGFLG